MSPITTHVLDTTQGRPAAGLRLALEVQDEEGQWQLAAEATTDADGRATDLLAPDAFRPGRYRLTFATGDYFQRQSVKSFYPTVTVEFQVDGSEEHYHVPLLLSPFAYSTYRGS